jgi:hypothetical protein
MFLPRHIVPGWEYGGVAMSSGLDIRIKEAAWAVVLPGMAGRGEG